MCHDVCRFNPLLGLEACHLGDLKRRASFEMSWRTHNGKLQQSAAEADDLESAAGKLLVAEGYNVVSRLGARGGATVLPRSCCHAAMCQRSAS